MNITKLWQSWFPPKPRKITYRWCAEIAGANEDFQGVVRFRPEDAGVLRDWDWSAALPDYQAIGLNDPLREQHPWITGQHHLVTPHTYDKLRSGGSHWIYSEVTLHDSELSIVHTVQGYTDNRSETILLCELAACPDLQVTDWSFGGYQTPRKGPNGKSSSSLLEFLLRRTL